MLKLIINRNILSQIWHVKFDKVRQTIKGSKVDKLAENYKNKNDCKLKIVLKVITIIIILNY